MNEDHIIAAILAAGLISKSTEDLHPKQAVDIYAATLTELIAAGRPQRGESVPD